MVERNPECSSPAPVAGAGSACRRGKRRRLRSSIKRLGDLDLRYVNVDRILKRGKAADLPIDQPTKVRAQPQDRQGPRLDNPVVAAPSGPERLGATLLRSGGIVPGVRRLGLALYATDHA